MYNEIVIEWKHIGKDVENTCVRCGETGLAVLKAVADIRPGLESEGIKVRIVETVIPDDEINESNCILFNGVPIEDLIEEMSVKLTPCTSCACITGQDEVECRAVEVGGTLHEAIPVELILRVIRKLSKEMNNTENLCCTGCGCAAQHDRPM